MIVRYASGALQNITRALNLAEDGLSPQAMAAVKERALEHRREEFVQNRALTQIAKAFRDIPLELRQRRHESARRRKSRAANTHPDSRHSSRPSSAASSRSTGSYVSARSSWTASSIGGAPGAAIGLNSSPLIGRGPSGGASQFSSTHDSPVMRHAVPPPPPEAPTSPLAQLRPDF